MHSSHYTTKTQSADLESYYSYMNILFYFLSYVADICHYLTLLVKGQWWDRKQLKICFILSNCVTAHPRAAEDLSRAHNKCDGDKKEMGVVRGSYSSLVKAKTTEKGTSLLMSWLRTKNIGEKIYIYFFFTQFSCCSRVKLIFITMTSLQISCEIDCVFTNTVDMDHINSSQSSSFWRKLPSLA